jgi:hypothetical protein
MLYRLIGDAQMTGVERQARHRANEIAVAGRPHAPPA